MAANSLVPMSYTDDRGVELRIRTRQYVKDALGGTDPSGAAINPPKRFKPRHAQLAWFSAGGAGQAVGKFIRRVPVPTVDNGVWALSTHVLSLPDFDSDPGVGQTTPNVMRDFTVTGLIGEQLTIG